MMVLYGFKVPSGFRFRVLEGFLSGLPYGLRALKTKKPRRSRLQE